MIEVVQPLTPGVGRLSSYVPSNPSPEHTICKTHTNHMDTRKDPRGYTKRTAGTLMLQTCDCFDVMYIFRKNYSVQP